MAQGDGALGNVGWAVVESETGREAASGSLDLAAESFEVNEHLTSENVIYFRKSICLTGPFSFSIDEHPGRTLADVKGFGLKAERDDVQSFSWEWFNVVSPTEAVKLQEEGKLAVEIAQAPKGWEVLRTEFLTDVSLRITRFDGDPVKEPSTRVTIRKGSWVEWPAA